MGVKSPRRAAPPASRKAAPSPRPAVALPSPSALSAVLLDLWRQHHTHDAATACNRVALHDRSAIAAGRCLDQIHAVEAMLVVGTPATAADAVAMLTVIRAKLDGLAWDADTELRANMHHLLAAMMPAMAVLVRGSGFDLAAMAAGYLSPDDALIACGGVPA